MTRLTRLLSVTFLLASFVGVPAAQATFPGTNGAIAFTRYTHGQNDIWLVQPGTKGATHLTHTRLANEGMPDWNAAGTKLAYSKCGLDEFSNCEIWIMNADGSGKERLTKTPHAQETWPTWSPDGSQIAYNSNAPRGFQGIWVMNADGTDRRRLTRRTGFDAFPEWSPDGTKIAFTSDRAAIDDIWVMDADGANPVRLTSGPMIDERPDWSPNGATLVFSRNGNIWTIGADGGDLTRLTATKVFEFAPTFSPNGKRIAYNLQLANSRIGVWVMHADGSMRRHQTRGTLDFFPDWQAN